MSSIDRYTNEHGTDPTWTAEKDAARVAEQEESHQEARRAAWRACRVNDAVNILILVLGFLGMAGTLGFALVGLLTGAGQ